MLKFKDTEHKKTLLKFMEMDNTRKGDVYSISMFYLLALNHDTKRNINNIYNFETHLIEPETIGQGWQTGTSIKVVKLAFNLFNGFNHKEFGNFDPLEIFSAPDAKFMWQAVKIRLELFEE